MSDVPHPQRIMTPEEALRVTMQRDVAPQKEAAKYQEVGAMGPTTPEEHRNYRNRLARDRQQKRDKKNSRERDRRRAHVLQKLVDAGMA
jgi:hypothetical protein